MGQSATRTNEARAAVAQAGPGFLELDAANLVQPTKGDPRKLARAPRDRQSTTPRESKVLLRVGLHRRAIEASAAPITPASRRVALICRGDSPRWPHPASCALSQATRPLLWHPAVSSIASSPDNPPRARILAMSRRARPRESAQLITRCLHPRPCLRPARAKFDCKDLTPFDTAWRP